MMKKSIVASTILSLIALNANAATQIEYFETQGQALAPAAESAVSATLDVISPEAETIHPEEYAPVTIATPQSTFKPFIEAPRPEYVADVAPTNEAPRPEHAADVAPNEAEMHRVRFGYGQGGTAGTADTLTNLRSTAQIAHNPGLAGTKTGEDAQKIMTHIYDAKANQEAHAETRALGAHVRQQEAATAQQAIDFTPATHNAAALVVAATDDEPVRPEDYAQSTIVYDVERGGADGERVRPETYTPVTVAVPQSHASETVSFETSGQAREAETFTAQVEQTVNFKEGERTTPAVFGAVTEQWHAASNEGLSLNTANPSEHATADVARNTAGNESVAHMNRYSMRGNFDEHTAEGIQNIAHNPLLAGKDVAIRAQTILEREAVKALESDTPPPAAPVTAQNQADSGTKTIRMAAAAVTFDGDTGAANAGAVQADQVQLPAGHTTTAIEQALQTAIDDNANDISTLKTGVGHNVQNIVIAQKAADQAQKDADAAQTTADKGVADAADAHKLATQADKNANDALTQVKTAQDAADKAQDTADANTKALADKVSVAVFSSEQGKQDAQITAAHKAGDDAAAAVKQEITDRQDNDNQLAKTIGKEGQRIDANEKAIAQKADQTSVTALATSVTKESDARKQEDDKLRTSLAAKADKSALTPIEAEAHAAQTAANTNTKGVADNKKAIAINTNTLAQHTQQMATVTAAAANIKTDEAQIKQNKADIATNQKAEQTHFTTLQSSVAQKVSTGTFQQRAADVDARIAQHKAEQEKVNKGVADHLSKHDQQIADLERSNGGAFRDLKNQIDGNRKKANAGTSTALAAAGIPQVTGDQNFALGAATGGYEGEQALAVGFSARVSSNVTVKAAVGTDSQHGVGYNAGVAIGW